MRNCKEKKTDFRVLLHFSLFTGNSRRCGKYSERLNVPLDFVIGWNKRPSRKCDKCPGRTIDPQDLGRMLIVCLVADFLGRQNNLNTMHQAGRTGCIERDCRKKRQGPIHRDQAILFIGEMRHVHKVLE